jgi:PKD repeat protein
MKAFYLSFLFILLSCIVSKAQLGISGQEGIYVDGGATMYIAPSTTLHIDGDLTIHKSQGPLWVRSNGNISLTGNLTCTDPFICQRASENKPTSTFTFSPKTPTVTVTGTSDSIFLYHTIINKAGTIVNIQPNTNLHILDTLDLQAGSFQLAGGYIHFIPFEGTPTYINHPYLKNENNQNRIFGDNGQVIMTLRTSGFDSNITPANLGLTLKGPSIPNDTLTIRRGHAKQAYAGNGSITRYYDIVGLKKPSTGDSLLMNYIDSVELINLGINKNKLKVFASFGSDIDYTQVPSSNSIAFQQATASLNDVAAVNVPIANFRVTIADEDCKNPPISNLTTDTLYLCQGVPQILDAGNNTSIPNANLSWQWNNGATTQKITVNSTNAVQQFTVILKDVRGCTTKDTVTIMPTSPSPSVDYTAYPACFGDSVKFVNRSTISSGTIANYNWQFGDGTSLNTSVSDTLKKKYNTAQLFYLRLTATSDKGCIASRIDSVWAFPLPTADFSSNMDCINNFMKFTSTSIPGFGTIRTNYWNLDTVASATMIATNPTDTPTRTYTQNGNYYVKLLVETYQGCKSSIIKTITIAPKNTCSFIAVTNACLGDTIAFVNTSVCNSGSCNYVWDFGDGTQSIASSPKKIFTSATVYNVKLKVLSSFSCTDSSVAAITIAPKPLVNFTAASTCFGNISYFTNNSTITTGSISSYTWDFGNSTTASTTNASLTYLNPGNYTVNLSANSDKGCLASISKNISIFQRPIAQYNVPDVCLGQPSLFNQNSTGNTLSYLWNFGNTATSTASNPTYTYPTAGTYTTSLIVSDANKCSDTSVVNTTVFAVPTPSLGGVISTCGNSYVLDAGPGASYDWQPLNATTRSVTVHANGNYSVTVTSTNGCKGSDVVQVKLNEQVKPRLGKDTTVCGSYLLNAGYPGSSFLWNTGATTQTVLATISNTYIVTVADMNNCIGKDTIQLTVNTLPALSLGSDLKQCQTKDPIVLTPTTDASIYLWNDGSTQSTLTINKSADYTLTVTAANGCKKSDTIAVDLLPAPIVDLGTDAMACGEKIVDAQNIGSTYAWSTGATSQTITAKTTGNYWVIATNPNNGCTGTDSIQLTISAPVSVFLGNDTSSCSNNAYFLDAGNPGSTYSWSTGATTQKVLVGSGGAYGVTVTNGACSTFDAIQVTVINAPFVDLGNDIQYICNSGSLTLNAGTIGSVKWGSNTGFTSTQRLITVDGPGIYWVAVTNGPCTTTDTVQILKSDKTLTAYFIASTIDTVGRPVKFVDVSQPTPTSWLWDFGDGFTSTIQSPEHIFLTPQTFNVSLTISNGFCTSKIEKTLKVLRKIPTVPKDITSLQLIQFSMYPNPTDQTFNTLFELNDKASIRFSIYDISGRLVYQENWSETALLQEETTIPDLHNGMYLVEILAESNKGFVKRNGKLMISK